MADYRLTQTGQQVQNDLNNAENDHTTLANHVGDSSIHVTPENKTAWNAKYDKPGSGIPSSDLAQAVQKRIVVGERFTADGFRTEDLPIIEKGILKNFSIGLYAAKKTK